MFLIETRLLDININWKLLQNDSSATTELDNNVVTSKCMQLLRRRGQEMGIEYYQGTRLVSIYSLGCELPSDHKCIIE